MKLTRLCLHVPSLLMLILLSFYLVGGCPLLAFPFCECLAVYSRPLMSTMLQHVLCIPSRFLPRTIGNIFKLAPRCASFLPSIRSIGRRFAQRMVSISSLMVDDESCGTYSSKHMMLFNCCRVGASFVRVLFVWTLLLVVLLQAASARNAQHSINSESGMKQRHLLILVCLTSPQHRMCTHTLRTNICHISSILPCEARRIFP